MVALQEVDSMVERTGRVDQTTVLGQLTGMHSVFGTFFDYQGGRYGMSLLSRYPFISYMNHLLPKGVESRAALAVTVRLGDDGPEIIGDPGRRLQLPAGLRRHGAVATPLAGPRQRLVRPDVSG